MGEPCLLCACVGLRWFSKPLDRKAFAAGMHSPTAALLRLNDASHHACKQRILHLWSIQAELVLFYFFLCVRLTHCNHNDRVNKQPRSACFESSIQSSSKGWSVHAFNQSNHPIATHADLCASHIPHSTLINQLTNQPAVALSSHTIRSRTQLNPNPNTHRHSTAQPCPHPPQPLPPTRTRACSGASPRTRRSTRAARTPPCGATPRRLR